MAEAAAIDRHRAGDGKPEFERLRSEAIELLQRLSGQVWTDHNLHDPGITILEQLIYALTDLCYRCDFALEDYLAGEDGRVNLEAQALHPPAQAFPCRPATPADYRKLLLNALPEVDNAWLRAATDESGARGLYRLAVKLANDLAPDRREAVVAEIERVYHRARNLCEDLAEIRVIENIDYELVARIEIGSARYPADILADIYFACGRRLASAAAVTNFDQIDAGTARLDELFDGPFTARGFFADEAEAAPPGEFSLASLFAIVNAIEGVDQIHRLCLCRDGREFHDRIEATGSDGAFDLAVPTGSDAIRVELTNRGRVLPVSVADLTARYTELRFKYYASRAREQDLSLLYPPIAGRVRPLKRYLSIQEQFPAAYGINRFGLPASAADEDKARTRQLKGYLLIFEQFLVNFLANLDAVGELYSPRTGPRRSYATQPLEPDQVADLEALYPPESARAMGRILANFDRYDERKSRLLDYLLALYGERFSQNSLRHFNYYYGRDEFDAMIVANKVRFLNSIIELGRDRAAAPDYRGDTGFPASGLGLRAAMLLGFERPPAGALTAPFDDEGIELLSQAEYARRNGGTDALRLLAVTGAEAGEFVQPPMEAIGPEVSLAQLRRELDAIVPLRAGGLSESLLRGGIDSARLRVGRDDPAAGWRLCFALGDGVIWQLGSCADERAAVRAANALRAWLLRLNRHSEGLHILEHVLLRPRHGPAAANEENFFSFRISVLLPGWSKRCHDREFRNLVRETIRLNAPAHVFAEFYWLDFAQMHEFEDCYRRWLESRRESAGDAAETDRRARALIDFLAAARATQDDEVWLPA